MKVQPREAAIFKTITTRPTILRMNHFSVLVFAWSPLLLLFF